MFRAELLGSIHQSNRETFGPYPDIQMIRFSGRIHFIDGAAAAAVQKVPSGCVDTAVTGIVARNPTPGKVGRRDSEGGTVFPQRGSSRKWENLTIYLHRKHYFYSGANIQITHFLHHYESWRGLFSHAQLFTGWYMCLTGSRVYVWVCEKVGASLEIVRALLFR